jgi:hypothetical protein
MEAAAAAKAGPGVRQITVALPDSSFEELVEILRQVWVVREGPGIRGCDPCRSGIDRLIIEDPALRFMR